MALLRRFLRDPLLHFLVVGGALFAFHASYVGAPDPGADDLTIVIDEKALLGFMQDRARVFADGPFREQLASLSPPERRQLIDDYVREEVLYREAVALGLDRDDYIIRRRLVQKLEFVTETLSRQTVEVTPAELRAYFDAHRSDYRIEPTITFTHVFFDAERGGREAALAEARRAVGRLNAEAAPFEAGGRTGDLFPFHQNYVERTPDFVASHFGSDMAAAVFAMPPGATWQGPFESPYGAHAVMVSARTEARDATLEEIEGRVREDAVFEKKSRLMNETVDALVAKYEVRIELPAPASPAAAAVAEAAAP